VESRSGSAVEIIAIEGKSDNPEYSDIYISGSDIDGAIIGKVILSMRMWGNN
jgi:hypothetical protein